MGELLNLRKPFPALRSQLLTLGSIAIIAGCGGNTADKTVVPSSYPYCTFTPITGVVSDFKQIGGDKALEPNLTAGVYQANCFFGKVTNLGEQIDDKEWVVALSQGADSLRRIEGDNYVGIQVGKEATHLISRPFTELPGKELYFPYVGIGAFLISAFRNKLRGNGNVRSMYNATGDAVIALLGVAPLLNAEYSANLGIARCVLAGINELRDVFSDKYKSKPINLLDLLYSAMNVSLSYASSLSFLLGNKDLVSIPVKKIAGRINRKKK